MVVVLLEVGLAHAQLALHLDGTLAGLLSVRVRQEVQVVYKAEEERINSHVHSCASAITPCVVTWLHNLRAIILVDALAEYRVDQFVVCLVDDD